MRPEYIYELLREHSRVIIPNFGAFMLKEKFKIADDGSAAMTITFNDFLKFNDGLLIDHVAVRNQTDKTEADQQIKEFISNIQYQLINSGEYKLQSIGTLFKDEKGNLKFRQETNEAKPNAHTNIEQPIEDVIQTETTNKTGLSPLHIKEEKSFSKPSSNITSTPRPTAPKPKVTDPVAPVRKTTTQAEPVVPQVKLAPRKQKKQLLPIWRYLLVFVLAIILILVALYFMGYLDKNSKTENPENINLEKYETGTNIKKGRESQEALGIEELEKRENQTINNSNAASVGNEDELLEETEAQEQSQDQVSNNYSDEKENTKVMNEEVAEPINVSISSNENRPFHVIAASFNDQAEAHEFVLKLREKGFINARIVNYNNGYYRVCYNSYSSKNKALKELKGVVEKVNKDAWYLYYKK